MANLLFFVSSMESGGAERIAALLANTWASRGHSVTLVPTYSQRGECHHHLASGVKLVFLADIVDTTQRSIRSRVRRLQGIRQLMKQSQPDAVVSFLSNVNTAVLLSAIGLGVRVVVSERIYPPLHPLSGLQTWLRKRMYPRAAAVVMQSERGIEWLKQTIPGSHGVVLYNPVQFPLPDSNAPWCPVQSIPSEAKLMLAVGRLDPQKGFDQLLHAFTQAATHHPEWHLAVLGEGAERATLENIIAQSTCADRIHLMGQVGNLGDWYERADLFVLSSRYEGFPNALLEAMSYGVAAISTACATGPDEIIEHGVNGWLLEDVDLNSDFYDSLAQALAHLMGDAQLRTQLGLEAQEIKQNLTPQHIAEQWEQLLMVDSPATGPH